MEKSKIDIIIVKKEIGGLVSAYKMNQKIFILSDFIKKYPFLDINNKEYFEIKTVELLPYGTKVKYQGETYHIIKVVGFKQFCADLIYGNDVVPVSFDGKNYSARAIAEQTTKKKGQCMCWDCYMKAVQA